jgi:hypothetical protein
MIAVIITWYVMGPGRRADLTAKLKEGQAGCMTISDSALPTGPPLFLQPFDVPVIGRHEQGELG